MANSRASKNLVYKLVGKGANFMKTQYEKRKDLQARFKKRGKNQTYSY